MKNNTIFSPQIWMQSHSSLNKEAKQIWSHFHPVPSFLFRPLNVFIGHSLLAKSRMFTNHTWIMEVQDPPALCMKLTKSSGFEIFCKVSWNSRSPHHTMSACNTFFQALVAPCHIASHLLLLESIQLLSSCLNNYQRKHWTGKSHPSDWNLSNREIESRECKWTNEHKVCFMNVTMFKTWHIMARFYPQPLSQLPSLPPKSMIHVLFYSIFKVRSECLECLALTHVTAKNDTFILSIRFSMLSADSWLGFQSHKLRMRLHVSLHLFTTDSSHIHQSNLWSSSKSGSGLRIKNEQNECKWAKWERNIWEIWANYEKQMMLKKIMKRKSPNNQL